MDRKKLNIIMYVDTFKKLKTYAKDHDLTLKETMIKALNFALKHKLEFKTFLSEYYKDDITTLRTFKVSEDIHKKIKKISDKYGVSMSQLVDAAIEFYLKAIGGGRKWMGRN